jgi:HEAT repeat protein
LHPAAQSAPAFAAFALENGVLLRSVQHSFRASDPASVAILGQVVDDTNGNLPFRRAAAFALAAIHTQQALPYLAALMTDADPEMRAESVRGFGSFANGLPVPTMAGTPSLSYLQPQPNSAFRTDDTITRHALNIQYIEQNESQYLPFWRAWWQTNHAALGY